MMRRQLQRELANGKRLTVSEIRDLLATSRKFAVPICEYLDRIGFTRRDGDLRSLRECSSMSELAAPRRVVHSGKL